MTVKPFFPTPSYPVHMIMRTRERILRPRFLIVCLSKQEVISRSTVMSIAHAVSAFLPFSTYQPYTNAIPSLYQLLLIANSVASGYWTGFVMLQDE